MGWAVNLLTDVTILPSDSDPGTSIEMPSEAVIAMSKATWKIMMALCNRNR